MTKLKKPGDVAPAAWEKDASRISTHSTLNSGLRLKFIQAQIQFWLRFNPSEPHPSFSLSQRSTRTVWSGCDLQKQQHCLKAAAAAATPSASFSTTGSGQLRGNQALVTCSPYAVSPDNKIAVKQIQCGVRPKPCGPSSPVSCTTNMHDTSPPPHLELPPHSTHILAFPPAQSEMDREIEKPLENRAQ